MDKKYKESHPWITFSLNAGKIPPKIWLLLGEAQSKCRHLAGVLLDPEIADRLRTMYLAKGVLATTAIEGNTLSEEQIARLLEGRLELPKSKEYLAQEARNIIDACNEIADELVERGPTALTPEEICGFNALVLRRLELEEGVVAGAVRKGSVGVGRYRGAPAEDCDFLLKKLCEMLEGEFSLGEGFELATGILKALIAHLYIAWIHPFGDGNGRTARLIEFKICLSSGIPDIGAHLFSNHYNETRSAYYRALDETSRAKSPNPFIEYALQGYVDQLGEQINIIRKSQCRSFWTNYVHRLFHQKGETSRNIRRRKLILNISEMFFESVNISSMRFHDEVWVSMSTIHDILSPGVAKLYMDKTQRTLTRDINELVESGLLAKKGSKVRPRFEILDSFVPIRVAPPGGAVSDGSQE